MNFIRLLLSRVDNGNWTRHAWRLRWPSTKSMVRGLNLLVKYEERKPVIQADSSTVECLFNTEEVAWFESCSAYHLTFPSPFTAGRICFHASTRGARPVRIGQ